ncbi:unnamed protein product [Ranitomeya imitator]|uniref:Reverse transcriptase domain-containing protein n=1 Tax=Ranitomeya imitator TaxID=111125 RepID=A0ABN9MF12_9NEOB|nr:unnamed protein product [Ranitomeya imitator]
MVVDDEEKANILNTFFSTVFTAENEMLGEIPRNNENPILRVTNLTQEEVRNQLNKIKIDKSPGPDGIHPRVLRELSNECTEEDLIELKKKSSCNHNRPNLSKLERKALEEIRGNQDLMVRRADKGGAVVLLNAGLYVQQNMVMLNNSNTYRRLQHDPTELFKKKLKHLLSEGFAIGALDKKLSEDLFVEHPIIPIFHSLPKIHKEVFPPTFRPIVAGIGSMGENLSTWVDMYLQPLISRLPGYIKDTKHLISSLDKTAWSGDCIFISCDVEALYPSLMHDLTISILRRHLQDYKGGGGRLAHRGYPSWMLQRAESIVEDIDRETMLNKASSNRVSSEEHITFTTTYSPQFKEITDIIRKRIPMLSQDKKLNQILSKPVRYIAKKAPSLNNILSPSLFVSEDKRLKEKENWLSTKGTYKCGHNICTCCKYMVNSKEFHSSVTKKTYKINHYINCNTSNVVYLINCTTCEQQYVGCTGGPLKNHRMLELERTSRLIVSNPLFNAGFTKPFQTDLVYFVAGSSGTQRVYLRAVSSTFGWFSTQV